MNSMSLSTPALGLQQTGSIDLPPNSKRQRVEVSQRITRKFIPIPDDVLKIFASFLTTRDRKNCYQRINS